MKHSKAIIIGAGVSGLYTASLLEKAGIDSYVLEARQRIGGRVLSSEQLAATDYGLHVDMGATWLWPAIQPELVQLIHQLDIPLIAQTHSGDSLFEQQFNSQPRRYPGYLSAPESFRLAGGMQALTAALQQRIPSEKQLLHHQVTKIRYLPDGIQVSALTEQGEYQNFCCEHVFLALPPALAAEIEWIPALPGNLLTGWRQTPTWMAPHAKYVAIYPRDFLREQQLSGDASSRVGPMVEIHNVSEPGHDLLALFGFIGVPAPARWRLTDSALKQRCREQLVRLFGSQAATPLAEFIKDWAADPLTATQQDLTQPPAHAVAQSIPDNHLWEGKITPVASEWSPQFSGYLAGAIEAATIGVQRWLTQS